MQAPTRKQLPRRLGILQILLRADIAKEDDLADLLAVFGDVDEYAFWLFRLDDADGEAGDEAVALARHARVLLFDGEDLPDGHVVAFGYWAIGFC